MPQSENLKGRRHVQVRIYDGNAVPADVQEFIVCMMEGDVQINGGEPETEVFYERDQLATCGDLTKPLIRDGRTSPGTISFTQAFTDPGDTTPVTANPGDTYATLADIVWRYPGGHCDTHWTDTRPSVKASVHIDVTFLGADFGEPDKTWTCQHAKLTGSFAEGSPAATFSVSGEFYGGNGKPLLS